MNQTDLDYQEIKEKIKDEFNKLCTEGLYKRGILATSKDNHVTARRMRLIPDGLTLYAWTDSRSMKIDQIRSNPIVAVVAGFIQVEGKASLCGHPLKPENKAYIEAYRRKLPESYEKVKPTFESVDHIELIKIDPVRISLPSMADVFSKDVLDVSKGKAYKFTGIDWTEAPAYKDEAWVV
jgi:hypothetical protein